MACLDMFNTDHQGLCTPMSPRISFSNDFIDTNTHADHLNSREILTPPLASSEQFEFSVSKYTMMPADELFFKGTLLPFKKTTLRDELLVDEEDVSVRPPKVPTKWKEFWGLKKTSNIVSKKVEKISTSDDESMGKIVEMKGSSTLVHEEIHISKISQEFLSDRESLNRDVEMKI
ncbi:membrane-associated kinase regulator-like protein [Thalictrum thalictroides]|uniref:Membrane-associated kinase regulator-like protein n=1 Tax=Thalictrum thalictroides TaxID=46969 RepID=A0A7J6V6U6_THATH|nr:membrane-associated kinase regulator-like protein [Thalictrum thalictroides]